MWYIWYVGIIFSCLLYLYNNFCRKNRKNLASCNNNNQRNGSPKHCNVKVHPNKHVPLHINIRRKKWVSNKWMENLWTLFGKCTRSVRVRSVHTWKHVLLYSLYFILISFFIKTNGIFDWKGMQYKTSVSQNGNEKWSTTKEEEEEDEVMASIELKYQLVARRKN